MKIGFSGLRCRCFVGVLEHEKLKAQELLVSVEVSLPDVEGDHLEKTIDYCEMEQIALQTLQEKHHNLIETKAALLIEALKQTFGKITAAKVRIEKPEVEMKSGCYPFVEMERKFK